MDNSDDLMNNLNLIDVDQNEIIIPGNLMRDDLRQLGDEYECVDKQVAKISDAKDPTNYWLALALRNLDIQNSTKIPFYLSLNS